MISKNKINVILIYIIFFLTFLGFYGIVMVLLNIGMSGVTRFVTIPVRALIGLSLMLLAFINFNKIKLQWYARCFLIFIAFYIFRILCDYNSEYHYYLNTAELLFYVFSFALIPFLSISLFKLNLKYISVIENALFYSSFVFSLLAYFSYSKFIGQVTRLSSNTGGEEVISPLILSYCATFVVGFVGTYMFYNKTNKLKLIIGIVSIILSIIPFFLGASRGSLIALFIPFLIMLFSGRSMKFIFMGLIAFTAIILGLIYLDANLGSGLMDRFMGIGEAVETGSNSASRIVIWNSSFNQFLNNPFLGDRFKVDNWDGYPHNLFIEVLQTTGVLGFIPFVILTMSALRISFNFFKNYKSLTWVPMIFLQSFIQNMFSGAVFSASWFWLSMALLFSCNLYLNAKNEI